MRIVISLQRFLIALAWAASGIGAAQAGDGLTWVPGESQLACLSRTDDSKRPAYPEREQQLKDVGTVRVSLSFVRPDAPPKIETTYSAGGSAFVDAVTAYVKAYRLPCLAPGAAPVIATQEFRFRPEDDRKVVFAGLRDHAKAPEALRCVTGLDKRPEYPVSTLGETPQGTVLVALKFVDATSPPEPKVLYDGGSPRLASAVLATVGRYRMPCLTASDGPLTAMQTFAFVMEDSKRYALKDVGLQQFLAAVDGLEAARIRFDFATMGCPFELRIGLYQPHAANVVGELEQADPNRREFIEWLRGVSLKLPRDAARQVVGQSITVAVPCGVLERP